MQMSLSLLNPKIYSEHLRYTGRLFYNKTKLENLEMEPAGKNQRALLLENQHERYTINSLETFRLQIGP